jgi:endonuclease/exonuclease/phosphatase family metal-dependent hydrolase
VPLRLVRPANGQICQFVVFPSMAPAIVSALRRTLRRASPVVACLLVVSCTAAPADTAVDRPRTFKVATWNIRSGMGVRGFATRHWDDETLNCTDRSRPLNAWGLGLPQKVLAGIAADPEIVAFGVNEAWNCAAPDKINALLGFKVVSREQQGVTLLARHGTAGPFVYERIDVADDRWAIGAPVCLDASCSASVTIFATHLFTQSRGLSRQARALVAVLDTRPQPQIVLGDFNAFRIDRWNPWVACTERDEPTRVGAITTMEDAGYIDAWKATNDGEGWTGMASRRNCGYPNGNLFKRIDYVYSKGLRPVAVTRFARTARGMDSPSDHVGLVATFAWP